MAGVTGDTRIQLCGHLVVRVAGRRVDGDLPGRQGRALLAYAIVNRNRSIRRDELREAVWPEHAPQAASGALDALLSKVRRAVAPAAIDGRSDLRLTLPAGAWIDVEAATEAIHRAESAIAQEQWARAWGPAHVVIHTGNRPFLPDHDAPWVDEQRARLEDLLVAGLECLASAGLGIGVTELTTAERAARRLVRLAPFRESGYRLLMEVLAAQGNVAEALRVHDGLRRLLREELAIAPGAEVQSVYDRLLRAG